MSPFKERLESRATDQEWFELQQAQGAYETRFQEQKITYSRFLKTPEFSFDPDGQYINNALFSIPTLDRSLLALLNSEICWSHLRSQSTPLSGGFSQADAADLETLPIPPATDAQKAELGALAEAAQVAAEKRYALQQDITRRIPDLAATGPAKLTTRLKEWWNLPDFAAFQAEVKKAFKSDIPLRQRSEWDSWISENRTQIHALTAEIVRLEDDINARVYALFDLTDDEIALLEANI